MIVKYKQQNNGFQALAKIYSKDEHKINIKFVDKDAITIVRRLQDTGYDAYIVGGAVRDLLLGLKPKDFDIVTSANPNNVSRVFRNSRKIGRRFKLVHVIFGKKIFEVSTFRSLKDDDEYTDNVYGTIDEDAHRRDFSINSFYYDPITETLLDFNDAFEDLHKKVIRSLIPLNRTFIEDPVRMERAVKYSVTTGFRIKFDVKCAIYKYASELNRINSSRMCEEVNKILQSGKSYEIFLRLSKFGLLQFMLPDFSIYIKMDVMKNSLLELDNLINKSKKSGAEIPDKYIQYFHLVKPLIQQNWNKMTEKQIFNDIVRQTKTLISPITPANIVINQAAKYYMSYYKIKRKKNK